MYSETVKEGFEDTLGIIFVISSQKCMLWVLIRIVSTHNECFYEEL